MMAGIVLLTALISAVLLPFPIAAGQSPKKTTKPAAEKPVAKFQVDFRLQISSELDKQRAVLWMNLLKELGAAGVSQVPGEPAPPKPGANAEPAIESVGGGRVVVRAMIGPSGNLFIDADGFKMADRAKLAALIKSLQTEGVPGPDPASPLWGLNQGQFELLRAELKPPGRFSLEDKPLAAFLAELRPRTKLAIKTTPEADALGRALRLNAKTANLSLGASLAYVLGQHGLAFEPRADAAGAVSLAVMPIADSRRPWPVGLVPQQFPGNVAPQLLQPVRYRTDNTPLDQLLGVVEGAIKIDVVLDRRALALRDIDAAALRSTVEIPGGTLTSALRRTFAPLGLKHELRIDEADQPFLWITAGDPTGLVPRKKNQDR